MSVWWSLFPPTSSSPDSNNWYHPNKLGRKPSDPYGARKVVPHRILHAHQTSRTTSGSQHVPTFPITDQALDNKSNDRWYHLHILHQQIGQSKVPHLMLRRTEIVELVYQTRHQRFGRIPAWTPEHHSRLTEQMILTRPQVRTRYIRVLQCIFPLSGFPQIHFFATPGNAKCPQFCSQAGLGRGSLGDPFLII